MQSSHSGQLDVAHGLQTDPGSQLRHPSPEQTGAQLPVLKMHTAFGGHRSVREQWAGVVVVVLLVGLPPAALPADPAVGWPPAPPEPAGS